jgi:hypothetical protein
MSIVLYYSNFCQNSKSLLQVLANTKLKEELHYLCIDNRVRKPNGAIYIILENRQEIILPPNISKVPAAMFLHRNNQVIFGKENIINELRPQETYINNVATNFNGEPNAFSFGGGFSGYGGVISDNYSFLDQGADELTAKGNGGMRQIHHYATLNYNDKINCPPEDYTPNKIGNVSVEKLQQERNSSISNQQRK